MRVLGLVPARGGSKGIPRKNLRLIAGKPLLVHSVLHGLQCPLIDRVIVSTDDEQMAAVAREAGADVPFLRPAEYATDTATDLEVFDHCLRWLLEQEGALPELVVQLRPTAPVRRVSTLNLAIDQILADPQADSLRSVSIAPFSPYKMWTLGENFELVPMLSHPVRDWYDLPRQKLPMVYAQNGFVDIVRPRTVLDKRSMAGDRILSFTHPDPVIDVDDEDSLRRAERLILAMESEVKSGIANRPLGSLQGRLSPSPGGALQNFPDDWAGEFDRAREAGLNFLELFVEREHNDANPFWNAQGRRLLRESSDRAGVEMRALCVDYVIAHPLTESATQDYVAALLQPCRELGIRTLVLPLLEASDLTRADLRVWVAPLRRIADAARSAGITVAVETLLDAGTLLRFLGMTAHPLLGVCYDTGNVVPLGHDIPREIRKLGGYIAHVHIKDKNREGANVRLGGGESPIREALFALDEIGYAGPMAFESVRGEDPVTTARENVTYLRTLRLPGPDWMIPRLCRVIHEAWVRQKEDHGYRFGVRVDDAARLHPAIRPYAGLSSQSIALESAVVRSLLQTAEQMGYRLGAAGPAADGTLIDALCRRAHEIWEEHQRSTGMRYGPITDFEQRTHRDLVPFEQISEEKKELDRAVVLGLLAELDREGFRFAAAQRATGGVA